MPTDFQLPPGGLGIRNPDPPMEAEKRLHGPKMAAVKAFVRANGFDRVVIDPPQARIGIDRKSTRLNSSHSGESRMPSSA